MLLRLTRLFTFEMAHALPAYEGKCRNIHGHSYHLQITVEGQPLQQQGAATDGMVMDFHQLKEIVNQRVVDVFDHALVLPSQQQEGMASELGGYSAKLIFTHFQPTSENLLIHFAQLLEGAMPEGTRLHSLKLYETESSCAELIL